MLFFFPLPFNKPKKTLFARLLKKKKKKGQEISDKKSIIVNNQMTDFRVNTLTLLDEILLPLCSGATIREYDLCHPSNGHLYDKYEATERKLTLILANERISRDVCGQPIERERLFVARKNVAKNTIMYLYRDILTYTEAEYKYIINRLPTMELKKAFLMYTHSYGKTFPGEGLMCFDSTDSMYTNHCDNDDNDNNDNNDSKQKDNNNNNNNNNNSNTIVNENGQICYEIADEVVTNMDKFYYASQREMVVGEELTDDYTLMNEPQWYLDLATQFDVWGVHCLPQHPKPVIHIDVHGIAHFYVPKRD
ncbi:hypothetical protein RFI_07241 [Reticulomyxa filosa]|uniref:SET domain-containing protein n=1 Tax=Reticulomyxa filosa TaxID=46433 RepID=X6NVQ0_RETFI|nr:hypothetical protein RFI_07241 [Reticulomyxa filosa]|eukprot:ETO29879.1 hypothetical protein RFI_07241 [Reticulomyxa filosa]